MTDWKAEFRALGAALNAMDRRAEGRFDRLEKHIMDKIDDIAAKFDELKAKWDEYLALVKGGIQKQIDDAKAAAVLADDAEEAVRLDALGGKIQTAIDEIPAPFDPSANG